MTYLTTAGVACPVKLCCQIKGCVIYLSAAQCLTDNPTVSINSHSRIISAPKPVTFNLTRSTNIPQSVAQLVSDMSYEAQLADPVSSPILFKLQSVKYRSEICSFYNVGKCTRPTPHSKTYRNDCEKMYIHLCAYCNAKFNLAMAHAFEECPFVMLRNHVPKH